MNAPYQDIVAQLRFAFPKPVSDRMHDAYFVFSFLRALDQVDALKSAAPILGAPVTLDYAQALTRETMSVKASNGTKWTDDALRAARHHPRGAPRLNARTVS